MEKKLFTMFMMSLLTMTAVCVCGCSSDEEGNTITPIKKVDESVSTFLNDELEHFDLNRTGHSCRIINSSSALQACYVGTKDLPDIDFDSFTLLIGQVEAPHTGCNITDVQVVESSPLLCKVYLHVGDSGYTMLTYLRFWRLYPKIPYTNIQMTVIKQKAN